VQTCGGLLLTASPFDFGLGFVFRLQFIAHGDAAENGVEDETTYCAPFQLSSASDSFGFFFGAPYEKSSFLITRHDDLRQIRISRGIQRQSTRGQLLLVHFATALFLGRMNAVRSYCIYLM
jgi:hypothetical protein